MNMVKKLSEDHWKYIKELLLTHELDNDMIEKFGFHYKTAFIHGYKHGQEQLVENYKKLKFSVLKKE